MDVMNRNVLLIEDDTEICALLELHLRDLGIDLDVANQGDRGLERALKNDYQLVILDVMLPALDGLEVCKILREKKKKLPILMLTARSEELDKVLGLELGADDYITKPFSIRELLARVKTILRRIKAYEESNESDGPEEFKTGDLAVNVAKRRVLLKNKNIELTAKEFELLKLFISNPGRAFSREKLLNMVWGYQFSGYEHTVNSHINRLRAKIEDDPSNPRYIKTVWGVGYKFMDEDDVGQ
ncbi:DNA-binding response regulator, OmpR family, contains REC and winged-helix (wHTH) domain [Caldithrix abyssi DSM 13497]|uniref:Phosphate regulon transcriptional regulatory protein PhoB n=2 Tax=Caldithrix abyssi DSM 13497 TaxID=880073 RepID=A0A1J1CD64_CALAY|nr:DNA-binding response regulator, OmpR family, contains REC and winged-helix (wHTH) domain [Caldithrix abyssi DSM 13497]